MALDEEQFSNLMKYIELRDLVIRIDENTKNLRDNFAKHEKDDAAVQALTKQSLEKLHIRVDTVSDNQNSIKNKILGAIAFATILITIVQFWFSIYNGFHK